MKKLITLTLLLLMSVSISVLGQTTTDSEKEVPYIEVTGTAEKEIIPNEIFIAITIREQHEGKVKITIVKQESDFKETLKEIGISLDNLSLADANYVKVKKTEKDVVTKIEYILKVENALTMKKVFKKLDELKIVDAHITKVSHSKIDEYKKEVRVMAIKAAKEKADYLLAAISEQTGKAMIVYEQSESNKMDNSKMNMKGAKGQGSNNMDGMKLSENNNDNDNDKIIQYQKIKFQVTIYVKFKIK